MNVTADLLTSLCQALVDPDRYGRPMSLEDYLRDPAIGFARGRAGGHARAGARRRRREAGRKDRRRRHPPALDGADAPIRARRGWKQVIFGHIGRKPEGSLKAVAGRLGELLNCPVILVFDWWDEATQAVASSAAATIRAAEPGSIHLLENTRRYKIERLLWDASDADVPMLVEPLSRFANSLADNVARVYVNEALSAGSLDSSSTVVPAAMDRVALGEYVAGEFDGPMRRCLATELVVFSGLKADKLDDLEAMIARGTIRWVFTAGSLAMALKKAEAEAEGSEFSLGVAEDRAHADKPYYIPPARVEQARRMLMSGRGKGIEFVLPVDFVLGDGRVSATIGPGQQQFDVGPATSELFELKVGQFLAGVRNRPDKSTPAVAFHNGVFGMFEDPRFEEGTRRFIRELARMKQAGVEVYVGGGEGGTALERYGAPDWVTHVFTAGGTVLNALGAKPVPYLQALAMAAGR